MSFFTKLFDAQRASSDGLAQPQREAIVDLLVLSMYIDNALSLSEEAVMDDHISAFSWEENSDVEDYVDRTVARARNIKSSPSATAELLESISERLDDYEKRLNAADLCERLLAADGKVEQEKAFLQQVRDTFKLN